MQGGSRKKRDVLFMMENMEHFQEKTGAENKKLICKLTSFFVIERICAI